MISMNGKKAQIGLEYIAIIGFTLILVGTVFIYASTLSGTAIDTEKASSSAKRIREAANMVYAIGPGAKTTVRIDLPNGVYDQILSEKRVGWKILFGDTQSDIFEFVDANVVGELPETGGTHFVTIQMETSGAVRIGSGLTVSPDSAFKTLFAGETKSDSFTLTNNGSENLSGISVAVNGAISAFTTITQQPSSSLSQAQSTNFTAEYGIPSNQAAGVYTGTFDISSTQGQNAIVSVQIIVQHSLGNVDVLIFNDADYSVPAAVFQESETVYYEVRLFDDQQQPMNVNDLDVTITTPAGATADEQLNQTTSNGVYRNSYAIQCAPSAGNWTVSATATDANGSSAADSNNFSVEGTSQSGNFDFGWESAEFAVNGTRLVSWRIENTSNCNSIVIDKMRVRWVNDTDGAKLSAIRLNNSPVWAAGGGIGSGVDSNTLADLTNFTIPPLTIYTANNELRFTKAMNNNSEDFDMDFIFTDGNTFTTPVYAP